MMKDTAFNRRKLHILLLCLGIFLLIGLFYLLAINRIGIPCLFRKVTGLMCPGCGNSRAAVALLKLDLPAALGYNLLFPLEFFYLAWVFVWACRQYIKTGRFTYRPPFIAADITVLILLMIWWVVRNLV